MTQSSQNGVWHFAKLSVHGPIRWDEGAKQGFLCPGPGPEGDIRETLVFGSLQKKELSDFYPILPFYMCQVLLPTVRSDSCHLEERTSLLRSSAQSSCQTCLWALQKHAADTSDQAGALNNRLASTAAAIGRRKRQPPGMLKNHRGQWWRPAILFRAFSMFLGTGAWAFRLTRQAAASHPS